MLPALIVGTILFRAIKQPHEYIAATFAWGTGAALTAMALKFWHGTTRRFNTPNFWTSMTIGAIAGAVVALFAAASAGNAIPATARAVAALLGSLQGAVVAWFIARPDLDVPPVMQPDPDETNDELTSDGDAPNPPTSR
jgi:hypothetical protein